MATIREPDEERRRAKDHLEALIITAIRTLQTAAMESLNLHGASDPVSMYIQTANEAANNARNLNLRSN